MQTRVSGTPASSLATLAAALRPRVRRALAFVAIAASAACGGDEATAPVDASLPGTYTLVALGGHPLPAVLYPGAARSTKVAAGAITLRADRTYLQTRVLRGYRADGSAIAGTDVADTTDGTFTERGAALTFRLDLGPGIGRVDVGTATVADSRLTLIDLLHGTSSDDTQYTYEK